ncbi:hypothetical protein [Kordia jejudonensis]|uniref:hypothetical protein n=1 Tax=Kordia jejudonensis TaxID=1348245 RepID=UPI000629B964|nr:hypothetical protein [Kordia jejudonensis]
MKKLVFPLVIFMLIISCNSSYKPFNSLKEKRQGKKLIRSSFNLSNQNYDRITENDSIVYSLVKSIGNEKLAKSRIERRLDSFIFNKYDQKKLLLILELDRTFPNMDFEFDKEDGSQRLDFSSIKDLKKFMKGGGMEKMIDSILGLKQIPKDSILKKKQN